MGNFELFEKGCDLSLKIKGAVSALGAIETAMTESHNSPSNYFDGLRFIWGTLHECAQELEMFTDQAYDVGVKPNKMLTEIDARKKDKERE